MAQCNCKRYQHLFHPVKSFTCFVVFYDPCSRDTLDPCRHAPSHPRLYVLAAHRVPVPLSLHPKWEHRRIQVPLPNALVPSSNQWSLAYPVALGSRFSAVEAGTCCVIQPHRVAAWSMFVVVQCGMLVSAEYMFDGITINARACQLLSYKPGCPAPLSMIDELSLPEHAKPRPQLWRHQEPPTGEAPSQNAPVNAHWVTGKRSVKD